MTKAEVLHAYRQLYRAALEAVHFSSPARYQIRDIIRFAFRSEEKSNFNPRRLANTQHFLRRAKEYNGTEHKILRNILHSHYWAKAHGDSERVPLWMRDNDSVAAEIRRGRYDPIHATVTMLNESMDICLRSRSEKEIEQVR